MIRIRPVLGNHYLWENILELGRQNIRVFRYEVLRVELTCFAVSNADMTPWSYLPHLVLLKGRN